MTNIIEAGKTIARQRVVKLTADMEVYTIGNMLAIVLQRVYNVLYTLIRLLWKVAGKELQVYHVRSWDDRHQEAIETIKYLADEELNTRMLSMLQRRIRLSKKIEKNTDVLSAHVVNFAAKGFKRELLKGLSVPEKVELVYEKYPHMKEKNERKTLSCWFSGFMVILLVVIMLVLRLESKRVSLFLLCVILEVVLAGYLSRQMSIRWAMHYIWLARSEYGHKLVDAMLMLEQLEENRQIEVKEDLQVLHSYLWLLEKEEDKLARLSQEKKEVQEKREKNARRMQELDEQRSSDNIRMRKDLESDNRALCHLEEELTGKIKAAKDNICRFNEQIKKENANSVAFYLDLWERYGKVTFGEGMCLQMLHNLSFADLCKLENRLYELNNVSDPLSLAEHKSGRYYLTFRTEQGDIAKVYIQYDGKKKKVCLCGFEREDALEIVPLTADSLQKIMERRGDAKEAHNADTLQYVRRIEALDAEAQKLRQAKYTADLELQDKIKQVSDLKLRMEKNAKHCRELEKKLQKAFQDKEQAEKLTLEYEEKLTEIIRLEKESEERKKELLLWKRKCEELNKKIQENLSAVQNSDKELEVQKETLQKEINSLESSLKFQTQIADAAKKKSASDEAALQKLEEANEQLQKNLKKARNDLALLEKKKEEFLKRRRTDEEQITKYKKKLAEAQEKTKASMEAMKEAQKETSVEKYQSTYRKIKEKYPMLSDSAATFFSTAEQFYAVFGQNDAVDYSVIIVEYCKVLETALWEYLYSHGEYEPEVKRCFETNHLATLGSASYIINRDVSKSLGNYSTKVSEIVDIRNEGAHRGVQGKQETEKIKNFLWKSELLMVLTKK